MDDLFQIIIYGIIIISFLSSFFKKKEQPKPPVPGTKPKSTVAYPKQDRNVDLNTVEGKQEEYDILREIENLFKGEVNIPQQNKQPAPPQREYINNEISDVNLDKISDNRMQQSLEQKRNLESIARSERKTSIEQQNWTRKKVYVDPKIEATAAEFEKVLAGPRKRQESINEFNRKLKNPRTVREYILFSEILGKPKALRR